MSGATSAIANIFKKPKVVKPATQLMPDPGSFATKMAARRKIREDRAKRETRQSTIKTNTYSNTNLGGTA